MEFMPINHVDDWGKRLARQDAFWHREIIDRPVVTTAVRRLNPNYPAPQKKSWPTERDRWFDGEYHASLALASVMNVEYLGDSLPSSYPNLGPEVFSAFLGAELEFAPHTSWSVPNLKDWARASELQFSEDNFYWKKLLELTDAFLEKGKGCFYTGMPDWHPGGDAIAAFRDPINLNVDLIERPDEVKALLRRVNDAYFKVYDFYYKKLTSAGQAISCWAGIVSSKKWYIPSDDFSCMISKKMFDDVFLPGIEEECRALEASIYHLDGPQALHHLDSLLQIKELNAIQWVPGAGHGRASDWMHVYKKCQAAGKGLQLGLGIDELDYFMENLRPEGLWIGLGGVKDRDHAESVIRKISSWR